MNALLIGIGIFGSVVIWPINRWVTRSGSRPAVYGFWLCLTGAILSGIAAVVTGQPIRNPMVWVIGGTIGVAFAIGFCLVVMYCLRIGPAGPTVVMNNMGMLWPVILGAVWLRPHALNALTVIGAILAIIALIGFGFSRPGGSEAEQAASKKTSRRWAFWAFVAWLMSGISQGTQLIGSLQVPDGAVAITFAYNTTSVLVLTPLVIRELRLAHVRNTPAMNWREVVGGVANGVVLVASMIAVLTVLTRVGAEVVFPFTVAGPMIVVLFLGQYLYKEHLDRIGWIACGLGTVGLIMLSVGQGV